MSSEEPQAVATEPEAPPPIERRNFLSSASSAVMAFGLAAGYGLFATIIGWFMFPFQGNRTIWQYVANLKEFPQGGSQTYEAPAGQKVVISRLQGKDTADDFIALSSVCPHLGCQVHWESNKDRFFCPCHNGAFDAEGQPLEGPPKDANQTLSRYPLKVENGLLFIEVPSDALV